MRQEPEQEIDADAILALNRAHEAETSRLDAAGLAALLAEAFMVGLREGGRAAFLIALDERARYDSPNFRWFRERYGRFVYVDRVVVAPDRRGEGLARALYEELFARAEAAGHVLVGCEVNLAPPNPGSLAFHAALGFAELGQGRPAGRDKLVAYLGRSLGSGPASAQKG